MEFHLTTKSHFKIHGYLYFVIVVYAQSGMKLDEMPAKRERCRKENGKQSK